MIFRNDRRQRFVERRSETSLDRRGRQHSERRARHATHQWFQPAFGAHLLGQISPEPVMPETAQRAYLQPEARTPLRPNLVRKV